MAICYRDRTFCMEDTCARFGTATDENGKCDRSLTPAVQQSAAKWWSDSVGNEEAPISVFSGRPDCYMTIEVEK